MRELLKNGHSWLSRRQTSILSAAFVIMATYGLSNLIGLFKTRLLISYFFGSGASLLDVYYAAFVIPDTVFQLLVIGSLSAAFIPVFTKALAKKESEAWHIASVSLNLVLLIFIVISAAIFIFAAPLSRLIAPGFNSYQIEIMTQLLRVMLTAQIFFAVSGFLTGMIQSHQRFLVPALAPVAYNIGIICGIIFLSPWLGIFGPALGVVIGAALHMLVQLPLAYHLGFRFTFSLNFRNPGVREILRLMPPRTLALGIDQVEQFISVILASLLVSGSLSILNVARLLYSLPGTLFGVTIGQAALPTLSRQSNSNNRHLFRATLTDSLLQIAFLALPVSTLFIILRIPIVRLVFGADSFPWAATLLTGKTLAVLSLSSAFAAIMQLVIRGFYALHDTRTPLFVGGAAALFDIVISVIAVRIFNWGVLGLAGAITATTVIETFALYLLLMRRTDPAAGLSLSHLTPLAKMIFTSFITGISLWIPMRLLDRFVFDTTRTVPLVFLTVITSVIGLSVYLLLSYLFRIEQFYTFMAMLRRISNYRRWLASAPAPAPAAAEAVLDPSPQESQP